MLEFVVYSNLWKGKYVDPGDVLLAAPYGQPAYLALIVCKTARLAWAHVSTAILAPEQLAHQLQALNAGNAPATVFASLSVRKRLSQFCPSTWAWPAPQGGGENASGLLARFNSLVELELGTVSEKDTWHETALLRFPETTTQVGDVVWTNRFTLKAWNMCLSDCAEFLIPEVSEQYRPWLPRPCEALRLRLQRAQKTQPPLDAPPVYQPPLPPVYLDGVRNYPGSVQEALGEWRLGAYAKTAVKMLPWPAVRKQALQWAALLSHSEDLNSSRDLASLLFCGYEWDVLDDALSRLEAFDVWSATFPLSGSDSQYTEISENGEQSLWESESVSKVLSLPAYSASVLPLSFYVQRFLSARFPIAEFRLASSEQLVFCAEAMLWLDEQGCGPGLWRNCAQTLLGLDARAQEYVRAWANDDRKRVPGSWGLEPAADLAENQALLSVMGTATERWIRMDELAARLRGSGVWARSAQFGDGLSPAMVVQACWGEDCRVRLATQGGFIHQLSVERLVCTESVARKAIQAGWFGSPESLSRTVKQEVLDDTGPLPARNCVELFGG